MRKKMDTEELLRIFPETLRGIFGESLPFSRLTEIRLRAGLPLSVSTWEENFFVGKSGRLSPRLQNIDPVEISPEELHKIYERLTQYSVFAHREEIGEGFLTLKGGHRAGLCGRYYYDESGRGRLKDISSINLRIAREISGCAEPFFPYLFMEGEFCHTLLLSPPGMGKTTCLRDIIRLLSDGWGDFSGRNVSVADERSEIGNRTSGGEGFYLGSRTDILDHCPKAEGLLRMLRTMTPEVIAADEIGGKRDIDALGYVRNCGCKLLVTVHGKDLNELYARPVLGEYLKEFPFERYVVLGKRERGRQSVEIYDGKREKIKTCRIILQRPSGIEEALAVRENPAARDDSAARKAVRGKGGEDFSWNLQS